MSRLAPLTGVASAVFAFVAFASSQPPPNANASGQRVIAYYSAHSAGQQRSDSFWYAALILLLFFAGSLRAYLNRTADVEAQSALMLVGAGVLVAGALVYFGMDFAAASVSRHLEPGAAQALNILALDLVFPFGAGGCVFGIAAGLAIVKGGQLPRWSGWAAIVFGIVSATPGALVGLILLILWSAVVGVLVFRRTGTEALRTPAS